MADEYNGEIGLDWVDASTLVTFEADTDYLIQNQGNDLIKAHVTDSSLVNDTKLGTVIPPLMQAHYKTGEGDLYLKSINSVSVVNISKAAASE